MKTSFHFIVALLITAVFGACKKSDMEFAPSIPTVNTLSVSSVTDNSAVCGGSIVSDGNDDLIARGVCYSTHPGTSISDQVVEFSGTTDDFSVTLSGLSPNTTYYVRAFATNNTGTGYGASEKSFTTSSSLSTVNTSTVTAILSSSVIFKGQLVSSGGGIISSAGFCYSTSPNPTIQNTVVLRAAATDTFSVHVYSLDTSTTYYVRAFATNGAGTAYGNELSFSTTSPLFVIGQSYQGGIIFYIDDSEIHGYIVAPSDQSTNSVWGCATTSIAGAVDSIVGSGIGNTNNIVTDCGVSSAAYICSSLSLNGYSDWFLPSKKEMEFLYQNIYLKSLGGFSSYSYWTSTQADANNAWSHNFSSNTQNASNKNSPYSIRAIREF